MSQNDSVQKSIDGYRKRQSLWVKAPLLFGLAALLLIVGFGVLIFWWAGPNSPSTSLFATATSTSTVTPTVTHTATNAPTATNTATALPPSETPTSTSTATPSGPQVYIVQDGDTFTAIAAKFNVSYEALVALNPNVNPALIRVGQEIIVPGPNTILPTKPTPTSVNANCTGTQNYTVKTGDTLAAIADLFYSTVDAIVKANNLKNANDIYPDQVLKIPCGIATPIPTATMGTKFPTAPIPPTKTPTPKP